MDIRKRRIIGTAGLIIVLCAGVLLLTGCGNRGGRGLFDGIFFHRESADRIEGRCQGIENAARYCADSAPAFDRGWIEGTHTRYYYLGNGEMATGWHYIGGKAYYFYEKSGSDGPAGAQAFNYTTSGGIPVPESGCLEGDEALAIGYALDVLDRYGWSLEEAFKYSSALRFERASEETYGRRIHKCALQGFTYGKGNCLAWSGTFCVMAKVMGYDCRLIWGTLPYKGEIIPHGWTEIWDEDGIHVYDPRRNGKTTLKGFNERYGQTGSFKYNEDSREYFEW